MSSLIVEICEITDVKPIKNADRIELVCVKGWECIVSKGQYSPGDLVIYSPIDSLIPQELSDAMDITKYLAKDGRVRTQRMRGVYSQGLVIPTEYLPDSIPLHAGIDVAEVLGIEKFEPPPPKLSDGLTTSPHPKFVKYTNIENIKNFPDILEIGEEVVISEKIHGTNFRLGRYDNKFMVGSHRRQIKRTYKIPGTNVVIGIDNTRKGLRTLADHSIIEEVGWQWKLAKALRLTKYLRDYYDWTEHRRKKDIYFRGFHVPKYSGVFDGDVDIYNILRMLYCMKLVEYGSIWWKAAGIYKLENTHDEGLQLFGEIYGYGIQVLQYGLKKHDTLFFDIMEDGKYLDYDKFITYCEFLEIPTVPLLYRGPWSLDLMDLANGKTTLDAGHVREGIVIKPVKERYDHRVGRVILKHISERYLERDYKGDH